MYGDIEYPGAEFDPTTGHLLGQCPNAARKKGLCAKHMDKLVAHHLDEPAPKAESATGMVMRLRRKVEARRARGWAANNKAMSAEIGGTVAPLPDVYGAAAEHHSELADEELQAAVTHNLWCTITICAPSLFLYHSASLLYLRCTITVPSPYHRPRCTRNVSTQARKLTRRVAGLS